jgi:hypothetical protein
MKYITTFILFTIFLNVFGQNIRKSGSTILEKKIENYIIEKWEPNYFHSIEFARNKAFDLKKLIADYKVPSIFSDEPEALLFNQEAFAWLEDFSVEGNISYYNLYSFATKEKGSDSWNAHWCILFLDNEQNIIEHINYYP